METSMKVRRHTWEWIVTACAALFFIVPLLAMARFALQRVPMSLLGRKTLFTRWTIDGVVNIVQNEDFIKALWLSVRIGLLTATSVLLLMIPTMLWLHLRANKLRLVAETLSLLPYVVPPIALVVGVSGAFRSIFPWIITSNFGLVPLYVILCLPFAYRTLDAGLEAIDLRTLVDASSSLGASPVTTLVRILIPNLWVSIASAAFLGFAVVLGEFAISSLLLKPTLPMFMVQAQGQEPQGAMAVGLLLLLFTTLLFFLIGRLRKRHVHLHQSPLKGPL
jgi:putative spermidine/putrescine transport system permease protein